MNLIKLNGHFIYFLVENKSPEFFYFTLFFFFYEYKLRSVDWQHLSFFLLFGNNLGIEIQAYCFFLIIYTPSYTSHFLFVLLEE